MVIVAGGVFSTLFAENELCNGPQEGFFLTTFSIRCQHHNWLSSDNYETVVVQCSAIELLEKIAGVVSLFNQCTHQH